MIDGGVSSGRNCLSKGVLDLASLFVALCQLFRREVLAIGREGRNLTNLTRGRGTDDFWAAAGLGGNARLTSALPQNVTGDDCVGGRESGFRHKAIAGGVGNSVGGSARKERGRCRKRCKSN